MTNKALNRYPMHLQKRRFQATGHCLSLFFPSIINSANTHLQDYPSPVFSPYHSVLWLKANCHKYKDLLRIRNLRIQEIRTGRRVPVTWISQRTGSTLTCLFPGPPGKAVNHSYCYQAAHTWIPGGVNQRKYPPKEWHCRLEGLLTTGGFMEKAT